MSANPNALTIEILAKDSSAGVIGQTTQNLKKLGEEAKGTGQQLEEHSKRGEKGLRSLFHTAEIGGVRMRDMRHVAVGAIAGWNLLWPQWVTKPIRLRRRQSNSRRRARIWPWRSRSAALLVLALLGLAYCLGRWLSMRRRLPSPPEMSSRL